MMLTLSSVRGAPGVSTWTMLLAAAWPSPPGGSIERVVIEADLDGGVAGARYGIGVEPGVDELVARLRHGADVADALTTAGRRIDEQGWLVPGPESDLVSRRIWAAPGVAHSVAGAAAPDARTWLVDAGRLRSDSPVVPLAGAAAINIVVTGDAPADLVQVPERVDALSLGGASAAVLVNGSPSYPISELAAFFGTSLVMVAPRVELKTIDLISRGWTDRRLRRSIWWRAALGLAEELSGVATANSKSEPIGWEAPTRQSRQRHSGGER